MLTGVSKVLSEVDREKASNSHQLHLSNAGLIAFPTSLVFSSTYADQATRLLRLDVSYNNLSSLPAELTTLTSLRELWLSNNPLTSLPDNLRALEKLECLDVRSTLLPSLPAEMCTLTRLFEVDWRDTPMEEAFLLEHDVACNDLPAAQEVWAAQHERRNLEATLLETLAGTHFSKEADRPDMPALIRALVQTLSSMYTDLVDFKLFVRSADNLLPERMADITPKSLERVKGAFSAMQRDTHRQRLSADVEIRLRNVYFDRADRARVAEMLEGIYQNVASLEDIQVCAFFCCVLAWVSGLSVAPCGPRSRTTAHHVTP